MKEIFEQILHDNDLLRLTPINQINKSCCKSSSFLILDFDEITLKFDKGKPHTPKSADCLHIDEVQNSKGDPILLFLLFEMKSFQDMLKGLKYKNPDKEKSVWQINSVKDFTAYVQKQFHEFGFADKIVDSYATLLGIAGYYHIDNRFYETFFNKDKCKIKFVILTDISSEQILDYELGMNYLVSSSLNFRFLIDEPIVIQEKYFELFINTYRKSVETSI